MSKERFTVDLGFLLSLLGKPGLMKWLTAELRGEAASSHRSQAAWSCTLQLPKVWSPKCAPRTSSSSSSTCEPVRNASSWASQPRHISIINSRGGTQQSPTSFPGDSAAGQLERHWSRETVKYQNARLLPWSIGCH